MPVSPIFHRSEMQLAKFGLLSVFSLWSRNGARKVPPTQLWLCHTCTVSCGQHRILPELCMISKIWVHQLIRAGSGQSFYASGTLGVNAPPVLPSRSLLLSTEFNSSGKDCRAVWKQRSSQTPCQGLTCSTTEGVRDYTAATPLHLSFLYFMDLGIIAWMETLCKSSYKVTYLCDIFTENVFSLNIKFPTVIQICYWDSDSLLQISSSASLRRRLIQYHHFFLLSEVSPKSILLVYQTFSCPN